MGLTEEQKEMKELIEEHCAKIGISLVGYLRRWCRKVDEPIGELIERVYAALEDPSAQHRSWKEGAS